jgi:hypothetical protein
MIYCSVLCDIYAACELDQQEAVCFYVLCLYCLLSPLSKMDLLSREIIMLNDRARNHCSTRYPSIYAGDAFLGEPA